MATEAMEGPVVSFTKGPGMITYSVMMIAALAALVGAMLAMWPTAPPAATLAGPEAEAAALTGQRRAAIILVIVSALVVLFLYRTRRVTFDFPARTLRVEDRRAFVIKRDRIIPFADIASMERHQRLLQTYEGWVLRIHLKTGGSLLLGPWAPDPGLPRLIQRVMG